MKKLTLSTAILALLCSCGDNTNIDSGDSEGVDLNNQKVEEVLEIDINLNKIAEIPSDCVFEGDQVDAYSWVDKNGINYFIRTLGDIKSGVPEDASNPTPSSQNLYAYHYTRTDSKADAVLLKETNDFVKDCEFDLILSHELDALTLTDIDNNEIGEIAFIYRTGCTSDVSPSTQKLIMLENGNKYPLRGTTKVMEVGGEFEAGEEFKSAPDGFQAHAEKLWSEHLVEYDFEL